MNSKTELKTKFNIKKTFKNLAKAAAAVTAGIMLITPTVLADDNAEFELFYDFEDFNANYYSNILPDEHWDFRATTNRKVASFQEESGNKTLQLGGWQSGILFFDRLITSGKMHISFDIKMSSDNLRTLFILEDGRINAGKGDELRESGMAANKYSRTFRLFGDTGEVFYNKQNGRDETYTGNLTIGWTDFKSEGFSNMDFKQWHRIDMVTTEMSKSDARIQYYIDGQPVLPKPLYFAESAGFKGFYIYNYAGKNSSGGELTVTDANDYVLVDNLSGKRYFDEVGLRGKPQGDGKVELTNGEMTVRLTERVDKELLTKDNMTIKGGVNNKTLTNYTVQTIDDSINKDGTTDRFKVKFSGEIDMGSYTITLSDKIKGTSLELPMITPIEFRTAPKIKHIEAVYLNDNFDDYTDDTNLPSGWSYQPTPNGTYHKQGVHEDNGYALGIENDKTSGAVRMIKQLASSTAPGVDYTVNFDVYSENMYWYLYLLENGDFDENTKGYDENVAVTAKSGGQISYAEERTKKANQMTKINGLTAPEKQWNNVTLTVAFNDGKPQYKIKVNDSETYTVDIKRDFATKGTEGIGFGYYYSGGGTEDSKLYIDNVKVTSAMDAIYPEVESMEFINAEGNTVATDNGVTSALDKIRINFNTQVDEEAAKENITVTSIEGTAEYVTDVYVTGDKSVAEVTFPYLLTEDSNYTISVGKGISSKYTDEVSSLIATSRSFKTMEDASFKVIKNEVEKNTSGGYSYNLTLVKNTDSAINMTAVAAVYEKVTIGDKSYDKLTDVKYIPIEVGADTKGIYNYTTAVSASDEAEVKTMLWKWSGNQKVKLSDGTTGEITVE